MQRKPTPLGVGGCHLLNIYFLFKLLMDYAATPILSLSISDNLCNAIRVKNKNMYGITSSAGMPKKSILSDNTTSF